MSEWAYLYQNTIRRTTDSFTCQSANFCKIFSKKFNTISGLFIHQLPTLPQKTILAKVWLDAKRGWFVYVAK